MLTTFPAEVTPETFRDFFQRVPAAATVVTTVAAGRPHATTVSSFCSLSLEPPLVMIALGTGSRLLEALRSSGRLAVNVLAGDQGAVGAACASKQDDKLRSVAWAEADGLPAIHGAAAWMSCTVERLVPAGDHEIVIARPDFAKGDRGRVPLLYHDRQFRLLAEADRRAAA